MPLDSVESLTMVLVCVMFMFKLSEVSRDKEFGYQEIYVNFTRRVRLKLMISFGFVHVVLFFKILVLPYDSCTLVFKRFLL